MSTEKMYPMSHQEKKTFMLSGLNFCGPVRKLKPSHGKPQNCTICQHTFIQWQAGSSPYFLIQCEGLRQCWLREFVG